MESHCTEFGTVKVELVANGVVQLIEDHYMSARAAIAKIALCYSIRPA
jgi:hypothetical protein